MTFEELLKNVSAVLKQITYKLNHSFSFFDAEDLYQEALIHLWQNFQAGLLQDKTESYILQGCYFHLKNYLRKTNSKKFRLVSLDALIDEKGNLEEALFFKNAEFTFDNLDTKLLIEKIQNNSLTKREKEVFSLCLEGLTVREMGTKLGISHVMVIKIKNGMRKKIQDHLYLT